MCAGTSSTIRGGILQNLLEGFINNPDLIFLLSQYNITLQVPGKKCHDTQLTGFWQLPDFCLATYLGHTNQAEWKSNFFLCSTVILICWIPCISSNVFRVLGFTFTGGTAFAATTWATLMPLVIVVEVAISFFTVTTTCLLPEITLVYVFTTLKPWGKWGPSPPFRDWVITCMSFPRSRVFI